MGKLDFDDEKATRLVIEWQTTRDEDTAAEAYEIYHDYFKNMAHKYIWVEDIHGIINECFMKCMVTFDSTKQIDNPNFSPYVVNNIKFAISNQVGYMYKPKYGVAKIENGLTPSGKKSYKINISREGSEWTSFSAPNKNFSKNGGDTFGDTIESNINHINDQEFKMIWEKALTLVKKQQYIDVIKLTLEGYNQTEIANELKVSQSRVSDVMRKLRKRNPEFYEFLQDSFNENK